MQYLYRIYYDKATGEVLHCRWVKGDIRIPTVDTDFLIQPELHERTSENTGLFEWYTEQPELESVMFFKMPVVDISVDPPALNWTDWPIPPDDEEISDAEALDIITKGDASV